MRVHPMSDREFMELANEAMDMVARYGFGEKRVKPYAFWMTVDEMTEPWSDFSSYTTTSRNRMKKELDGFLPILSNWIKIAEEPRLTVVSKDGSCTRTVAQSIAEDLVEAGFFVYA